MKEFKQNILIVCLNEAKGQEIAYSLANVLSMLYANSNDIVAYEVFDTQAVIEKCGQEYFEKREKSALKHISRYSNVVVSVGYDYFNKGYDFFKNTCNFVYVKAKKKQLEEMNYFDEILITRAGGVVTSHCGPGTLGVLFIERDR